MMVSWDSVQQVVRMIIGWVGMYLVGKGMLTNEMAETFTGGLFMLVQVGWWLYWNNQRPA